MLSSIHLSELFCDFWVDGIEVKYDTDAHSMMCNNYHSTDSFAELIGKDATVINEIL